MGTSEKHAPSPGVHRCGNACEQSQMCQRGTGGMIPSSDCIGTVQNSFDQVLLPPTVVRDGSCEINSKPWLAWLKYRTGKQAVKYYVAREGLAESNSLEMLTGPTNLQRHGRIDITHTTARFVDFSLTSKTTLAVISPVSPGRQDCARPSAQLRSSVTTGEEVLDLCRK